MDKEFKPVTVAVYGTLREGLSNHHRLQGCPKIQQLVAEVPYKMVSLGPFPALMPDAKRHEIVFQIYQVRSKKSMEGLDMLEGYPDFYNRKVQKIGGHEAWMYYLQNSQYAEEVKEGDWKAFSSIKK